MRTAGKRATIYDIARVSGVSTATVSRVLSNTGYPVSSKTRQRVEQVAVQLNYAPNLIGKALKRQKSDEIGIVIPNISNPYYAVLLQGVYDEAIARGYGAILANSYRDPSLEARNIRNLIEKQVDGLIAVSISSDGRALQGVIDQGRPLVLAEQEMDLACLKIGFDFEKGARLATQYLIDRGHTGIGFIGAPLDRPSRRKMLDGFIACMRENGLELPEGAVRFGTGESDRRQMYEFNNGKQIAREFSAMGQRPSAYLCVNDMTALGAIQAFTEAGLHVPNDVSVVGFDNIPYAGIATPALTTVDQSAYDMGMLAAKLLIDTIQEPVRRQFSTTLEPKIIERATVRAR